MIDIEGRPATTTNPYTGGPPVNALLPAHHPITILKRLCYMGVSLYGLKYLNAYRVILKSPHVRHEWFKIGLASSIALLGIKAYVEIFEGRINKKKVNYENFRQLTHAAIGLLLFSSLAFHIALWPHYGWNSMLVLGLGFFGVFLQFLLLVPSWLQNIVCFVALTFFLQEYS